MSQNYPLQQDLPTAAGVIILSLLMVEGKLQHEGVDCAEKGIQLK